MHSNKSPLILKLIPVNTGLDSSFDVAKAVSLTMLNKSLAVIVTKFSLFSKLTFG